MRQLDIDRTGKEFTNRWFLNRNYESFKQFIYPRFAGLPIVYLEIGCFEAQSLCWMLQHVLTHPASRAVAVDPWLQTTKLSDAQMEAVRQRAIDNVRGYTCQLTEGGGFMRCTLFRANSGELLRRKGGFEGIAKGMVDLCMIDGDHNALGVLDDANLVLPLMKPGGWMLFDDVENDIPKVDHVRQGLDWFLGLHPEVELAWKHRYCECYCVGDTK
jgi:hypothetical protein